MPSVDARSRLAAQQADLVRALAGKALVPGGFDTAQVKTTAESLGTKRAMAVARAVPALRQALGERFAKKFATYAAQKALPREGGPLADGRAFARTLASAGELPDAARLELLDVDLRFASTPFGLTPRRGPALAAALLGQPRRLLVGVRLPWLGVKCLAVRLGRE
jgi:hypothetical protein